MRYYVIREILECEEIGKYKAYGIELREKGMVLRRVSDVFRTYKSAWRFCRRCNRFRLSPEHLDDAIEDAIAVE